MYFADATSMALSFEHRRLCKARFAQATRQAPQQFHVSADAMAAG